MGVGRDTDDSRSTKMAERRKSSKPIMEKRRRERINNSLNELKNLLLESRKKDGSCCSKLEKADILEMTVQHLKAMRNHQEKVSSSNANDPIALAHYRAGFNQSCAEISRFLINAQDIEVQVRTRLLTHLSNSCRAVLSNQVPVQQYYPGVSSPLFTTSSPVSKSPEVSTAIPSDSSLTLNSPDPAPIFFNLSQVQFMPAALTNGKITAVLVPSTNVCTSTYQPTLSLQQPQLAPVSSPSNDVKLDLGKISSTSSQSPTSSTVWQPWRDDM